MVRVYVWIGRGSHRSIGLPEYGLGGQIQSPELSLGNNGGDFHVTITACGSTGDYLDIITSAGTGVMFPLSEEYETMEADSTTDVILMSWHS